MAEPVPFPESDPEALPPRCSGSGAAGRVVFVSGGGYVGTCPTCRRKFYSLHAQDARSLIPQHYRYQDLLLAPYPVAMRLVREATIG